MYSSMSKIKTLKRTQTLQIALLVGAITLSLIAMQIVQSTFAQTTKTFNIISQLDKKLIKKGDSETIRIKVLDSTSKQPISGVLVKAVVSSPGGTIVRSLSYLTDNSGQTSISIPTSSNAPGDTVNVDIMVSLTGFTESALTTSFTVISHNVSQGQSHHYHH